MIYFQNLLYILEIIYIKLISQNINKPLIDHFLGMILNIII